jgi:hypothetical protein
LNWGRYLEASVGMKAATSRLEKCVCVVRRKHYVLSQGPYAERFSTVVRGTVADRGGTRDIKACFRGKLCANKMPEAG